MTAATLDAMTPLQRLIVERALALAKELEATADSAPVGQVIDRCESLLLGNGWCLALAADLCDPGSGGSDLPKRRAS